MPIEFLTSLKLDLVYARWSGRVDLAMFRTMFECYLSDTHYKPGRRELIDFTDLEGLDADFGRVWSVLRIVNDQLPGQQVTTRTVLLAPDDVNFGFARMYQALADNANGIEVEVHRSEHDALQALDASYADVATLLRSGDFLSQMRR